MLKRTTNFILLVSLLFLTILVQAKESGQQLVTLLNQVHTMRANFVQQMVDKDGKLIQQTSGTMALQRPGKFRWEVKKPNPQLIIANEEKLWVYDPDLEQVTIRTLSKEIGETPALLLSHSQSSIEKKFHIRELENEANGVRWFLLTPKDQGSILLSVKVGFRQQQIYAMKLQDHLGHNTSIQFNDIQFDVDLPRSLFVFTPPAKVDVIDETRRAH